MGNIKLVEEVEYTGKFKVGDEVKCICSVEEDIDYIDEKGFIIEIFKNYNDTSYPYCVEFENGERWWFNEAWLELVTNNNSNRPASSHYHIDNNGNDVWNFADDNLSDERVKGFHQVNALKYIARYEKKHETAEKRIEDLEKAKVSIDKLIELERKSDE